MDEYSKENFSWFFDSLKPVATAYQNPELSFLVHRGAKGTTLVAARLLLAPVLEDRPDTTVEAGAFYGYRGRLSSPTRTSQGVLTDLLRGTICSPDKRFELLRSSSGRMEGKLVRNVDLSGKIVAQQRIYELVGASLSLPFQPNADEDWTLRSAETPYDGLNDLLADLGLTGMKHQLHVWRFRHRS